jgi:hypothetical protein
VEIQNLQEAYLNVKVKVKSIWLNHEDILYSIKYSTTGVEVQLHTFLTSALDGGEWSASCPADFTPREYDPGTQWTGSLVGPRAGLDTAVAKIKYPCPYRESNPSCPVRRSVTSYLNIAVKIPTASKVFGPFTQTI